ncbi:PEP-CTERM sorting domain-containing protein [Microseira sp. BLCC-F43]|jgi:hypothetical protein|uniref:PEP-CTERM sorting domain-containing protein n=1 Tax=Microseira sp. BLCC-F43 TaxID=3153602 RepID=UPI0035BB4A9A
MIWTKTQLLAGIALGTALAVAGSSSPAVAAILTGSGKGTFDAATPFAGFSGTFSLDSATPDLEAKKTDKGKYRLLSYDFSLLDSSDAVVGQLFNSGSGLNAFLEIDNKDKEDKVKIKIEETQSISPDFTIKKLEFEFKKLANDIFASDSLPTDLNFFGSTNQNQEVKGKVEGQLKSNLPVNLQFKQEKEGGATNLSLQLDAASNTLNGSTSGVLDPTSAFASYSGTFAIDPTTPNVEGEEEEEEEGELKQKGKYQLRDFNISVKNPANAVVQTFSSSDPSIQAFLKVENKAGEDKVELEFKNTGNSGGTNAVTEFKIKLEKLPGNTLSSNSLPTALNFVNRTQKTKAEIKGFAPASFLGNASVSPISFAQDNKLTDASLKLEKVPEPTTTLGLFLTGLGLVSLRQRRQRSRSSLSQG